MNTKTAVVGPAGQLGMGEDIRLSPKATLIPALKDKV